MASTVDKVRELAADQPILEDAMKMGVDTVAADRRLLLVRAGGMCGLPVAALGAN